jgi:hypothetical protein
MCLNETYNKVSTGKHLSDTYHIENGPKQGDALSPLLFNFALEYAIKKVQQLQVCDDDVNLLGDNIDTINKITETLTDASTEVGTEVNAEKTKYILLFSSPQSRAKSWHKNS